MKILITAKVKSIGPIEPTKKANGYTQRIVIEQPEARDDFNRVTQQHQVFQVEVFDKERSARFLQDSDVGKIREFKLWLKGEVAEKDGKEFYYLKLKAL